MAATKNAPGYGRARKRAAFGERDQQLVGYQELAKAAQRERDEKTALADKAMLEQSRLQTELAGLRADISALKGELAAALATIERQAGYLDRVHEADLLEDRPQWELPNPTRRPGPRVPPTSVVLRASDRNGYSMSVETSLKPWWSR
jgi:hypothetical protein